MQEKSNMQYLEEIELIAIDTKKECVLHYIQTLLGQESRSLFWRCQADAYEHAVEQLENAVESEGEKVVFVEFYK